MKDEKEVKKDYKESLAIEEMLETDGWRVFADKMSEAKQSCKDEFITVDPNDAVYIGELQMKIRFLEDIKDKPLEAIEFLKEYRSKQRIVT